MMMLRRTIVIIFIIFVHGEGQVVTPTLTLLSKVTKDNNTAFTCVAGANLRGSAVTFITPLERNYLSKTQNRARTSTYISAQGSTYSPDAFDCNFAPNSPCLTKWTQNGEVVVSSVSETARTYDLEPVTDERWESNEYGKIQQQTFKQEIQSIDISVRMSGEANLLLCEDRETSSCYWITLTGEIENKIELWNCMTNNINTTNPVKVGNCDQVGDGKGMPHGESYWTHFKLIMKPEYSRTLFIIRGLKYNNTQYTYIQYINNKLNIKKLVFYNGHDKKGLWKIHNYNYLSLSSKFADHIIHEIGPALQLDESGSVCVELYVAMCPTCTLTLGVSNTLISEVVRGQGIMQHWRLVRIKEQNLPKNDYRLQFVTTGDSRGFWLLDDVRRCHEDETRVISIETPINENDTVSCQALQYPDWRSSLRGGRIEPTSTNNSGLTVCNNQTYTGSSCAISCTEVLGTDCSKLMVCEPSKSRMEPACTCAAGYHGHHCQHLCLQGYYGSGCTRKCEPCEGRCLPASGTCSKCTPDDTVPECFIGMADQQTSDSNSILYFSLLLSLLLILLIFAVLFVFCRDRKTSNSEKQFTVPLLTLGNQVSKSYPIKVKQLGQYMKRIKNNKLEQQYKSLPTGLTKPCNHGIQKNNVYKNRFKSITAYDHSRVVLKVIGGDPYSDFINANYIDGYKQPKAYIATQGPKANTLNDFWRMIWQEDVELIVMLTSIEDDKQAKHEKYWPDHEKINREFIDISVKICKEDVYADYVLRSLGVTCRSEMRKVQHLQFTSWPDKGIPTHPQLLVPFFHEMRSISTNTPIVVHCSNGIGRTGTVILLDICVRMATQTGKINPLKYLHRMREQRVDMVACFDHYKLVHAVLLEYLLAPDSIIYCDNELPNAISTIIKQRLSEQITYFNESEWHHKILKNDVSPSSKLSEVVSYACDGEYVRFANAVSVDGFRAKDQYIVVPSLQGNAIKHFWTMIIEYNVEEAFVFEDLSTLEMWPAEAEQMFELPHMIIKCISRSKGLSYNKYKLNLQIKSNMEARLVVVLVQNPDQMSAQTLAQLAGKALAAAQRWRPVAVGGAGGAGLVVLTHVMERMLARHQCDVLGSLCALRACGLPTNLDQHQLQQLYAASIHVLDELDGYIQPIRRI